MLPPIGLPTVTVPAPAAGTELPGGERVAVNWGYTGSPAGFVLYCEWEAQSGFTWPVAELSLPRPGMPAFQDVTGGIRVLLVHMHQMGQPTDPTYETNKYNGALAFMRMFPVPGNWAEVFLGSDQDGRVGHGTAPGHGRAPGLPGPWMGSRTALSVRMTRSPGPRSSRSLPP